MLNTNISGSFILLMEKIHIKQWKIGERSV